MDQTTSRSMAAISSTSTTRRRTLSMPKTVPRINVESTDALGVLHHPKPERSKSGRRTRYVDFESPRPPNSRRKSPRRKSPTSPRRKSPLMSPRRRSPVTIQIEDVEGTAAILVSPTAKSRKKKGRRSAKRKHLDNAQAHAHDDREQTRLRTKSTSRNKTSSGKKLRLRVDAEPKPGGIRAPSPVILDATPSGDDVLMLKGNALIKQDSGEDFVLTPTRDILLRRGDNDVTESKQHYIRHATTAPLPKSSGNDGPPPHTQTVQLSSISSIPPRLRNRALAPLSESKTQLKSKAKTKRRSKLREKFASAKEMGAQIEEMTTTQDNEPAARGFVPSMPSMPSMPGNMPNKRVSTIRQKFVAAKALAEGVATQAEALAATRTEAASASAVQPEVPDKPILEYLFENVKDDQKVHASVSRASAIACFTCTWNMHGKLPPADLFQLLDLEKHRYHLYSIATQECERSIMMSAVNASKAKWAAAVGRSLGMKYVMIKSHTLQAINIILFVHTSLKPMIADVQSGVVATGIKVVAANMGNKGGVGICFNFASTSYLFVAAHFAAGQKQVENRNRDYDRITKELTLAPSVADEKTKSMPNLNDRFDVVIWQGDFNYRIDGTRSEVEQLLASNEIVELKRRDQLRTQRDDKAQVFQGMAEGDLSFAPTYKYDTGTNIYDTSKKKRVPAWTDRILYKPTEGLNLKSYRSISSIQTSDHKPVVGVFECPVKIKRGDKKSDGAASNSAAAAGAPLGQTESQVCCIQ